jgi:hypothetical protein
VGLTLVQPGATADSFLAQLALFWTIAIGDAMHSSRPHLVVIRVYDDAGNAIETHKIGKA